MIEVSRVPRKIQTISRQIRCTYPNNVDKLIIDVIRLHLLTNKIGHSSQDSIDGGDLAVPGEKRRDPGAIDASGLGASIDVFQITPSAS